MSIQRAIQKAERVLPGKKAAEGVPDPRWQAIIGVADYLEEHPEEVWRFTAKWGAYPDADLRTAIATCLLEHLLEHHFARVFPLVRQACRQSRRFADTFMRCGEFGQVVSRVNRRRFRALKEEMSRSSANQTRANGDVSQERRSYSPQVVNGVA